MRLILVYSRDLSVCAWMWMKTTPDRCVKKKKMEDTRTPSKPSTTKRECYIKYLLHVYSIKCCLFVFLAMCWFTCSVLREYDFMCGIYVFRLVLLLLPFSVLFRSQGYGCCQRYCNCFRAIQLRFCYDILYTHT